ncbi:MAG: hypothetical protein ABIA59_01225, partial [Candidatus Latescibacterota bacterium]
MDTTEKTTYYVIPKGSTQEEACTWQEIEAACRAGRLSPDTMIYLPDKEAWEKAIYTELRPYFRSGEQASGGSDEPDANDADAKEALCLTYDEASREARRTPDVPRAHLSAAAAALAVEDREAAIEHYQRAIALRPFNRQIATEIKRNLRPADAQKVSLLERPEPFWEDLSRLASFPLRRGIVLFIMPAALVVLLALFSLLKVFAAAVSFCWMYLTIMEVASGGSDRFDWRNVISDPVAKAVKPFVSGMVIVAELYLPFIIVAEIFILTGISDRPNIIQFIQRSEVMIVFMWVAGVVYLPAAFAVSVSSASGWIKGMDVRKVYRAIISMEMEYFATVVLLFVPVVIWGISRLVLGTIPVAGILVPVALGLYGLILAGYVIGLLSARYQHEWAAGT